MNLEFYELDLLGIGQKTNTGTDMAARLLISFMDKDAGRLNHVRLDIFAPKSPEITFSAIQAAARSNALEDLKAAVSALEQHDIPTLETMGEETRSDQLDAMLKINPDA